MQLPWWGWAMLSVVGFSGTALICIRLTAADLSPMVVNVYLFAVGLAAFLVAAVLTKTDLRWPAGYFGWLPLLGATVFFSNYAVVAAYSAAPNGGYVKAVCILDVVLVAAVIALATALHGKPLEVPWWKLAGMALCLLGALLVAVEPGNVSPQIPTAVASVPDPVPAERDGPQ
jgi:hypothetical protein